MNINEFAKEVYQNAKEHGFWDERLFEETIALIHSEWSEALEEARAGRSMVWYACKEEPNGNGGICSPEDEYECLNYGRETDCKYHSHKPEGIAVELIDGCIRVLDYLGEQKAKLEGGAEDLEYLVSILPEPFYKVSITELVAKLHLGTSQAYVLLRDGQNDPEICKKGFMALYQLISVACAWVMYHGIDAEELLLEKHEYNKLRPYKHGKKF